MTRLMNILRTKQGRNVFSIGLPTVASSLLKCARLGLNPKRLVRQAHTIQVWSEMRERQNWIQDKFNFMKAHIRRKWPSESSGFKTPARGASASADAAHDISRASADRDSMEIRMRSDTTIQPSVTSPSSVSRCSSVDQQVMNQFEQMKTMLSSFLGSRQETTRTAFCNYVASEVEALEDKDF